MRVIQSGLEASQHWMVEDFTLYGRSKNQTLGIIKFDSAAHYYTAQGEARYDATLREARKEKLYVSPTTIEKQWFANNFLDQWKQDQLLIACVENPRMPHETIDDYAKRVYEISTNKARTAATFGKEIHQVIEEYPTSPSRVQHAAYYDAYAKWHERNVSAVLLSEGTVVDNSIGVAGRFDKLIAHREYGTCLLDYKTQNVKKDDKGNKKPAFYDSWCRQLAFYSNTRMEMDKSGPITCINLVIDSNEACEPFEKVWSKDEIRSGLEDFMFAAYGFFKRKNFWPVGYWSPCEILSKWNQNS